MATSERAKIITQNPNVKTEEVDFCSGSSFAAFKSDTSTLKNMKLRNSEENKHQESTEKLSLNLLDLHKDKNSLNILKSQVNTYLIYNNKEIQTYATEDINWLGLKDNDVIDVKLRLKGGMNRTFNMDIEGEDKKKLEKLYEDLPKTKYYTSGISNENKGSRSRFADLISETISTNLCKMYFKTEK